MDETDHHPRGQEIDSRRSAQSAWGRWCWERRSTPRRRGNLLRGPCTAILDSLAAGRPGLPDTDRLLIVPLAPPPLREPSHRNRPKMPLAPPPRQSRRRALRAQLRRRSPGSSPPRVERQPVPLGVGAAPPPALRGRRDATRPGQVSLGARRRGASRPGRMAAPPADVRTGRPESSTCPGSSPKPRACRRRSPPGTVRTAPTSGSPPACASGRRRRYRRPSAGS